MIISGAQALLPDVIGEIAGESYKTQFTQVMLLAGMCFAPEITVGAYAAAWIAKQACKKLEITSVKQRVLSYCFSRLGGGLGKYWTSELTTINADVVPCVCMEKL